MKRMFKGALVAIAILLTGCGVANNIEETSEIDEVECTDGPNYSIFKITWILADGTEKCVQYFQPPSSTFQTVRDLLDKIANITG